MRDDFATYQFGILKFVKVGNTSRSCPNCEYSWSQGCSGKCNPKCKDCLENDIYRENKNSNIYICKQKDDCGFSTKNSGSLLEKNLHNSDEVAAYNIAKNAIDNVIEE